MYWENWLDDYQIWVSVRHPKDRLISCWKQDTISDQLRIGLEDYIDWLKIQTKWHFGISLINSYKDLPHIDRIIRLENINDDISIMLNEDVIVPHGNKSQRLPLEEYNITSAEWWWEPDMKAFDYD